MIAGKTYYFFRLDEYPNDRFPVFRIAESVADLHLRFGDSYMRKFSKVTQLNEVTLEHIQAIDVFLLQLIS